jgi:Skp family chaperone for outer membrane proteins
MTKIYRKILFFLLLVIYSTSHINAQSYPIYKKFASIAVLDQDALFSKSHWGLNILNNVEIRAAKLAMENRSIEKELETEELSLTKIRKIKSKLEFNILALEFDKKVKNIRNVQNNKQLEINNYLKKNRVLFFQKVTPILLTFIDELGVEVLLNKDTVALASFGSDITNVAISRINENLNIDNN